MRFLALGMVCLALSCGPGTKRQQTEPDLVAPSQLVDAYRQGKLYDGRLVQLHLSAKSYRVLRQNKRIEAEFGDQFAPGILYCEAAALPADEDSDLVITGRVRGLVRDGIQRFGTPGTRASIDWHVLIEACSITTFRVEGP